MNVIELAQFIENAIDHCKLDDGREVVATVLNHNGNPTSIVHVSVIDEANNDSKDFVIDVTSRGD